MGYKKPDYILDLQLQFFFMEMEFWNTANLQTIALKNRFVSVTLLHINAGN